MAQMRSRTPVVFVLVTGMLMSMSGTALAVTGISGSGSSGVAQYGAPESNDEGAPAPRGDEGGTAPGAEDKDAVLGEPRSGGDAQVPSQVSVSQPGDTQLPFTGFLAIPLLVIGVAALCAGLVLRRRLPAAKAV